MLLPTLGRPTAAVRCVFLFVWRVPNWGGGRVRRPARTAALDAERGQGLPAGGVKDETKQAGRARDTPSLSLPFLFARPSVPPPPIGGGVC